MSYQTTATHRLAQQILQRVRRDATPSQVMALQTRKGNTQVSERICIEMIRKVLDEMKLRYTEASSQQPYDFRIRMPGYEDFNPSEDDIRNHRLTVSPEDPTMKMLLLEIKKTDTNTIYFNDTCPSSVVEYIVFRTGKRVKKRIFLKPSINESSTKTPPQPQVKTENTDRSSTTLYKSDTRTPIWWSYQTNN